MKICPICKEQFPDSEAVCPTDKVPLRRATDYAQGALLRAKYEILEKVGEGGMGTVYKARHLHFNEICALKVVKSHLLGEAEFVERFRAEAVVMRRLKHPNAVQVIDYDETEDGRPFMVMEYVEGESLDTLLARTGPLEPTRAIRIARQVCLALGEAHRLGIIHRDIKPSNILLTKPSDGAAGDHVKVLDFGVAKVKESSQTLYRPSLTGTGFVVGTPEYMSPEQAMGARGDDLDGRTDLYSLGVVLYEMLTGQLPFSGQTPVQMLLSHVQIQPQSPRAVRRDLPPLLADLVLRTLEKQAENRFPDADAMEEALRALEEGRKPPTPKPTQAVATKVGRPGVPPTATLSATPARAAAAPPARTAARPQPSFQPLPPPAATPVWLYGAMGLLALAVAVLGIVVLTRKSEPVPAGPPGAEASQPEASGQTSTAPVNPPAPQDNATATPATDMSTKETTAARVRELLHAAKQAADRGDRETAKARLQEAAALAPNHPAVREAMRRFRQAADAERAQAEQRRGQEVRDFILAGRQAMDAGRYEDAIQAFEAALNSDPASREAQVGLQRARRAWQAEQELLRPRR
jgi:serine/threonine-protein kinase